MLTKELQIAGRAKKYKREALTNLHQFIDEEMLQRSYLSLNKKSSPGVDGKYWHNYSLESEFRIPELLKGFKSGKYKAPSIRRVYIDKGKTCKRPLGIPTIEDKVLQESVRSVLTPIYEEDFKSFSYGSRRGHSTHQAIEYMFKEVSFKVTMTIPELNAKIRGHYNYYGMTFNDKGLYKYYLEVKRLLHKWLNRRGGKAVWNWVRFTKLTEEWMPLQKPKIYHSYFKAKPI